MTTSSRKLKLIQENTNKHDPEDAISDEYIRDFYGITEPLTGDDLDKEVQKRMKANPKAYHYKAK